MDWFRMYGEFASDPKVQSMSEAMQRRLMMLFCLRCSNTLVTLHETEIAFALRITDDELAETKALFIRKKFISEDWEINQWDKRQFVSDSSSARVAKHREKKKEEVKQECNVSVTPQIQNRYRTDTDTDTEKKKNNAPKKSKAPSKISLPDGFQISEAVLEWAKEKGHSCLEAHFENFVSACKAKGYVYADWDQALKNAIRDNWAKVGLPQARASPKPEKFDPLAYVNRNRNQRDERTIDINEFGEPV